MMISAAYTAEARFNRRLLPGMWAKAVMALVLTSLAFGQTWAATSGDGKYNALNSPDVSVTYRDDVSEKFVFRSGFE